MLVSFGGLAIASVQTSEFPLIVYQRPPAPCDAEARSRCPGTYQQPADICVVPTTLTQAALQASPDGHFLDLLFIEGLKITSGRGAGFGGVRVLFVGSWSLYLHPSSSSHFAELGV